MKKYIALTLTILMLASIFTAYIPVAASASADPVTLRFSWWGDDTRHKATLEAIKLFEAKYPNIKIQPEYAGWTGYQDKQTTQIAGGTAADVMQINWNWLPEYSKSGTGFYDLKKVAKEAGLSNYTQDMLNTGTVKGKLNAIPVALTGRVFYFNKTIYEKFGVPVPRTWSEILNAPSKFADGYYPIDLSAYDAWLLSMTYVVQRTGKQFISNDGKLVFTQNDIKVGLQFYKNLIDRKVAESIQVRTSEGGNSLTPVAQLPSFLDGKYAGIFEWTSAINKSASPLAEKKMEMVCGKLPMVAGHRNTGAIVKPSMMFAINKNCKNAKEAATFLNFILNDPQGAKAMGANRGIPVSKAGLAALNAGGQVKGLEYEGIQYLISNPGVPISPYLENAKLQSVYQQTIEQLSYGKLDVDGAAKYMYDNVQAVLKQIAK
jgi:oligogalacturonide transport system substrate-binding protein